MSNYIELYSRSKARYLLGVCWMGFLTQLSEHKWHIWCSRGAKMQQVFQMSVDDAGWWICTQTAVRDLNMNQGFGVFNTRDVFENLFSLAIPPHTNLLDSLGCQLQIVRFNFIPVFPETSLPISSFNTEIDKSYWEWFLVSFFWKQNIILLSPKSF